MSELPTAEELRGAQAVINRRLRQAQTQLEAAAGPVLAPYLYLGLSFFGGDAVVWRLVGPAPARERAFESDRLDAVLARVGERRSDWEQAIRDSRVESSASA